MPSAFIAWAVEQPTPQLLQVHPDLDQVIAIDRRWMKSISSIRSVRKKLRHYKFDICVDPQSIFKSAVLGYVSGAKHRFGFGGKHGRELSRWFNNRLINTQHDHLVDRTLDLLTGLGLIKLQVKFKLPIKNEALNQTRCFLRDLDVSRKFVVINPGASWPSKRWMNDRFAMIAKYLATEFDLDTVVTWCGESELADANEIVSMSEGTAYLAPKTDLQQLAAILYQSSLFIGCDTGPMHLAAATGCVCVGLYGPTRPQDSGAYGPHHFAVQKRFQDGSCRERRNGDNDAMREISVAEVCDACAMAVQTLRDADSVRHAA